MKKLSELSLSDLVTLEGIVERKRKSFYYENGCIREASKELTKTKSLLVLIKKEIQTRIEELELCLNIY